jgi:hypothetical protein
VSVVFIARFNMTWIFQSMRLAHTKGSNRIGVSLPSPEDGSESNLHNIVFSIFKNTERWSKSRNPVILSVIYHHQNILVSNVDQIFGYYITKEAYCLSSLVLLLIIKDREVSFLCSSLCRNPRPFTLSHTHRHVLQCLAVLTEWHLFLHTVISATMLQ